jgi:hypothetical protein
LLARAGADERARHLPATRVLITQCVTGRPAYGVPATETTLVVGLEGIGFCEPVVGNSSGADL